jgi:hypothetical protein
MSNVLYPIEDECSCFKTCREIKRVFWSVQESLIPYTALTRQFERPSNFENWPKEHLNTSRTFNIQTTVLILFKMKVGTKEFNPMFNNFCACFYLNLFCVFFRWNMDFVMKKARIVSCNCLRMAGHVSFIDLERKISRDWVASEK